MWYGAVQGRCLMYKRLAILVALFTWLSPAPRAHAQRYQATPDDPSSGFMIQALLGGSAVITSANDVSPFLIVPTLRIGAMLRPLAIAGNISYYSSATFSNT